jgi:transcriptional regulator with XRE-family HTH domain/uncharacterized cupin superfamily protein
MKTSPKATAPTGLNTLDPLTFGKRLRSARKQFGWTLAHVAELSGVSVTTISRAERGQLALSYQKFSALGQALQMDVSAMFSESGDTASQLEGPVLTRAGKGVTYRSLGMSYEFLGTAAAGKLITPALATVHARGVEGPEDYAHHVGEEFVYILSGAVEVRFEDGNRIRLTRGDSLYFDSRVGHAYVSVSRQPAKAVAVTTSDSNMMRYAREGAATAVSPNVVAQPKPEPKGRLRRSQTAKSRPGHPAKTNK